MEYTRKELKELMNMVPRSIMGNKKYLCLEDVKQHPLSYELLSKPLDQMPLYLNSEVFFLIDLAKWRLDNNK